MSTPERREMLDRSDKTLPLPPVVDRCGALRRLSAQEASQRQRSRPDAAPLRVVHRVAIFSARAR
jgi:hypothetical protein